VLECTDRSSRARGRWSLLGVRDHGPAANVRDRHPDRARRYRGGCRRGDSAKRNGPRVSGNGRRVGARIAFSPDCFSRSIQRMLPLSRWSPSCCSAWQPWRPSSQREGVHASNRSSCSGRIEIDVSPGRLGVMGSRGRPGPEPSSIRSVPKRRTPRRSAAVAGEALPEGC